MKIKELEALKECNELDILYKIIEKAEKMEPRTEESVVGNKSAGIEVRKKLSDMRILISIMRDIITTRNNPSTRMSVLDKEIQKKQAKDKKEEEYLQKLEKRRYGNRQE